MVGDWNGSGTTKIGIYRTGTWYLDRNGNGVWDAADGWLHRLGWRAGGRAGGRRMDWQRHHQDRHLPRTAPGISTRTATASGTAPDGWLHRNWGGVPEDVVVGDWNGSGTTKIGIYRNGTWYLDRNGNGVWDGTPTDGFISTGVACRGTFRWSAIGMAVAPPRSASTATAPGATTTTPPPVARFAAWTGRCVAGL